MNAHELMIRYGVVHKRRYRRKQKDACIRSLLADLAVLGRKPQVVNHAQQGETTLWIGAPEQASVIVSAYLDTPVRQWIFRAYRPLDDHHANKERFYQQVVPVVVVDLLVMILVVLTWHNKLFRYGLLGLVILASIFMGLVISGIGNRVNYDRDTSSLVAMLLALEKMEKDQSVVFRIIDDGCVQSYPQQVKQIRQVNTQAEIIFLDCLATYEVLNKVPLKHEHKVSLWTSAPLVDGEPVIKGPGTGKDSDVFLEQIERVADRLVTLSQ